jgi:hypothetical protein
MRIIAGLLVAAALGCGSSSPPSCADGGGCGDDRQHNWGLTRGPSAYAVTSIRDVNDGCMLSPASMVDNTPLMVDYVEATHVVSVGAMAGTPAMPALGSGTIAGNMATLTRENDNGDGTGCTWHQKDVSMFALFDHDKFTLTVREERSMYSSACSAPAGGACASGWTWTVEKK